ncbi:MAG TPA: cytochrome c biogenesis protein CcdA [Streptosporangiaceae bacterium]|nr:cytochrome c biogenesis protein CcdA [Streptosporangiaceae bacterium]
MGGGVEHLILSGPVLLAIPVAAAAGAITFMSPCCLPLVPGYLSYLTGMSGAAANGRGDSGGPTAEAGKAVAAGSLSLSPAVAVAGAAGPGVRSGNSSPAATVDTAGTAGLSTGGTSTGGISTGGGSGAGAAGAAVAGLPPRGRVMLGTLLFVLGFSVLFALEGVTAASVGDALLRHREGLTQILGGLIIVLGLLFIGLFDRFSFAGRIVKPGLRPRAGLAGAPLLGVLFGLGWTPCTGPTLSAVLLLGSTSGTALRGGLLAFVYALGIGIPFLIVAFAFQRGVNVFGFARRHARTITRVGGVLLIAVGVLEVSGAWASAITWLQVHWLSGYTTSL